jgi:hypothetical protein
MEYDFSFIGLTFLVVGSAMIVFRKGLSRRHLSLQNKTWGSKFGEKELMPAKVVIVIVGAIFVIIGILQQLGLMRMR